jgi:hypothetical protein
LVKDTVILIPCAEDVAKELSISKRKPALLADFLMLK